MTVINSQEDFLRALSENPEWRAAVRAQILGDELLELPAYLKAFIEHVDSFIAAQEQFNTEQRQVNAAQEQFNAEQRQFNTEMREFRSEQTQAGQHQNRGTYGQDERRHRYNQRVLCPKQCH